jgi:S-adenosylmethionine decarboxylase
MDGLHIIANFKSCNFNFLNEKTLLDSCIILCAQNELHVVGHTSYEFQPQGFTFTLLLSESHLCMHTWPELNSVAFDIYTCNHTSNNNQKTMDIYHSVVELLKPNLIDVKFLNRQNLQTIKN